MDKSWEEILEEEEIPCKKRSTGVLVALCPIHNEKTPSCHFWNVSGHFYCHGCQAEGDKESFPEMAREGREQIRRVVENEKRRSQERQKYLKEQGLWPYDK